jgi:hypothetical protein
MTRECRNCGASELQDLGPIGNVAPFFLKRVLGMELRLPRSTNPLKQKFRELAAYPISLLKRLTTQNAFVDLQVCTKCCFISTKVAFHDEDIVRLYSDYRSPSYNQERIHYEPSYAPIAAAVGYDEKEVMGRTAASTAFLSKAIDAGNSFTILDYGGSDGRFLPHLPGAKFVYEISNIDPVPGVTRIGSESELGTYSLVHIAHVTEHVPHPLKLIRKLRTYIKPGGYLYVETPQEITDQEREGLRNGSLRKDICIHEHINSYCVPAVSCLLQSAGFELIDIERAPVDLGWTKGFHIRALGRLQNP